MCDGKQCKISAFTDSRKVVVKMNYKGVSRQSDALLEILPSAIKEILKGTVTEDDRGR